MILKVNQQSQHSLLYNFEEFKSILEEMSPPEPRKCPKCEWKSPSECTTYDAIRTELMIHVQLFHLQEEKKPEKKKRAGLGERFKRPELKDKISEDEWNIFLRKWDLYKTSAGLDDEECIPHLYACLDESVETKVFRSGVNLTDEEDADETLLLERIKKIVVEKKNVIVRSMEFRDMMMRHIVSFVFD